MWSYPLPLDIALDRDDLLNLCRGAAPVYHEVSDFLKTLGYYSGGFDNNWVWNYNWHENILESDLIKLYFELKSYQ